MDSENFCLEPFDFKNIPLMLDILTPMWCAPYGDDEYRRFSVENIVRNNIFENDYRFQLVDKNDGTFLSSAFFARKSDVNRASQWLKENFHYPKEAMIPLEYSRNYIDEMDIKTRNLMQDGDIQMTLFVSRRPGGGSRLLEEVAAMLRNEGWKNLYLWTDCDCKWEWYPNHGFDLISQDVYELFSDEGRDYLTYIFKKPL